MSDLLEQIIENGYDMLDSIDRFPATFNFEMHTTMITWLNLQLAQETQAYLDTSSEVNRFMGFEIVKSKILPPYYGAVVRNGEAVRWFWVPEARKMK